MKQDLGGTQLVRKVETEKYGYWSLKKGLEKTNFRFDTVRKEFGR